LRRLDIGIAAYRDATKLQKAVFHLRQNSITDWRLLVVDNPAEGSQTRSYIEQLCREDERIECRFMAENVGYAGAVNEILAWSQTEYCAYLDHDAYVQTKGWDEALCGYLDRFHEIGLIFPNGGAYQIVRGPYTEVLWQAGFCWIMNRLCMSDLKADGKTERGEVFDTALGHQEEADVAQRVRMAGWKCAAAVEVGVQHDATATSNPASTERISRGVVNWVDKWNRYFNGKNFNYHSVNVTRFEDWPPNALYLEEWWKQRLPSLNDNPEVVTIDGRKYDLIRVPRFSEFYRGRII
jgi:glycosyltransferase involved in cell wall biosynthesis